MANIKKIKIGETTYDIRDASVPGQISTAVGNLDGTATVASESNGTITITKTVAETDGKIGNGSGSTNTYTAATQAPRRAPLKGCRGRRYPQR